MIDNIIFFYRDPLFGIIILIAIIATIAILDYSHHKYRSKKKSQSLKNLAKSYEHTTLNQDMMQFIAISPQSLPSLMLIAKAYAQSGDSQMAIHIYLSLLESIKTPQEKILILEALGNVYLKAGFLQRAKDIFTQILKTYPRNANAMTALMKTFENMGEYQKALETLDCLDAIKTLDKQNFNDNKNYFYLMILLGTHHIPIAKKIDHICKIGKNSPILHKPILKFLKMYDLEAFWHYLFELKHIRNFIDLLWEFPKDNLPKDLKQHEAIFEIFIAKGYIDPPDTSIKFSIFELEILYLLQKYSDKKVYLAFEYRCHHCKSILPFDSLRCPHCGELGEMDVILKPMEAL